MNNKYLKCVGEIFNKEELVPNYFYKRVDKDGNYEIILINNVHDDVMSITPFSRDGSFEKLVTITINVPQFKEDNYEYIKLKSFSQVGRDLYKECE